MEQEVALIGGRATEGVVRIGDTVRRPIKARAPFVHELLHHFEKRGFSGVPRFLGIDTARREVLSFLPGYVPVELGHFSDAQLIRLDRLTREKPVGVSEVDRSSRQPARPERPAAGDASRRRRRRRSAVRPPERDSRRQHK